MTARAIEESGDLEKSWSEMKYLANSSPLFPPSVIPHLNNKGLWPLLLKMRKSFA